MSLWTAIYEQVRSRRWLLPLVLAMTAGLSALGALKLRFTEDVFELLPQNDPTVVEGRLALARFRALERIVIDVEAHDTAAVVAGIDQLAAQLARTPGISKVTSRLSDDALVDIAQAYEGKIPLLFDEAMEADVERRTTSAEFTRRLQEFVDSAEGKGGIQATTAQFRRDPFAFQELMLRRFDRLNSGFEARLVRGHLISHDGRHGLLIAEASVPASNTREGRRLMAEIDGLISRLPDGTRARVIGGHRSAADNADVIESDIKLTVATSVLGVLAVFLLAFRSLWPFAATLCAVGLGFGVAMGAQGATVGTLSAITAGFGAALLGIAVDYTIHLATAVSAAPAGSAADRVRHALAHVAWPNGMAMITTALALSTLWASRFAGISQLAEIAVVGVLFAFLFAMLLGPVLLAPFARRPARSNPLEAGVRLAVRSRRRWPRLPLVACALATPLLALGLMHLSIDGDVTHLDGKSQSTREAEEVVAATYGGATLRRTLIVSSGPDLETALLANDNVARGLRAVSAARFESLAWVLPARQTQQANLARWRAYWTVERIETLKQRMAGVRVVRHTDQGERPVSFTRERVETYFAEFFATLTPQGELPHLDASSLRGRPLWDLMRNFVAESDGQVSVATLAMLSDPSESEPGSPAAVTLEGRRLAELKAHAPAALALNRTLFASHIVQLVRADLFLLGGLSLLLVIVVLWLSFGSVADVLTALIPVGGAMAWTLGLMGWLGISFNIINTLVTVLIAGLGIDYGIFVVQTYRDSSSAQDANSRVIKAATGISAAALTTLFGFGSLALAAHPALFSVGITTTLGVLSALLLSVVVVPGVMERRLFSAGSDHV
ncbi:hypothetical protein EDM80_07445 [bacterium]|nr:MAG: hypothetical protein EDM80_07445 [bacterium]RIK62731.1 MAG: hypothetical protein DCC64_09235 [Planctomycetota bacterium]